MSYWQVKTIDKLERLRNSRYGNPRYRITFTSGEVHVTAADAALNYAIENSNYWGRTLDFQFGRWLEILDMREVRT